MYASFRTMSNSRELVFKLIFVLKTLFRNNYLLGIYIYIYIVIVIVIFIWWSPFIPSRNIYIYIYYLE